MLARRHGVALALALRASSALCPGLRVRAAAPAKGSGKSKKSKGDAAVAPPVSLELREKFVVGANIYKDGPDPPIKEDSEYPDWLWTLLEKQSSLSELQRRDAKDLTLPELQRLCKLENRANIKESNAQRSKS